MLPDTHAHLDAPEFREDVDAVVDRAIRSGVDRILAVGEDMKSSKEAVALARRYEIVFAAVGTHPHYAEDFAADRGQMERLLDDGKVVAVGEIGLDYARGRSSARTQQTTFETQLAWARERGLPACVHNRDADDDVLDALLATAVPAVLHCFSGTRETARRALDAGHYLSFAGNLTFPKAEDLRRVAAAVPVNRVLVESDSPVLAPQPWRGRRNEPAYVLATATLLAGLHGTDLDGLAAQVTVNADALFHWGAA